MSTRSGACFSASWKASSAPIVSRSSIWTWPSRSRASGIAGRELDALGQRLAGAGQLPQPQRARADAAERDDALGVVRHLEAGLVDGEGPVDVSLSLERAGALEVPSYQPLAEEIHQTFRELIGQTLRFRKTITRAHARPPKSRAYFLSGGRSASWWGVSRAVQVQTLPLALNFTSSVTLPSLPASSTRRRPTTQLLARGRRSR